MESIRQGIIMKTVNEDVWDQVDVLVWNRVRDRVDNQLGKKLS